MRLIDADATIKYLREFRCKDCDRRKVMKNGKIRFCYEIGDAPCRACDIGDTIDYFLDEDISPTVDAVMLKEQAPLEPYACEGDMKCGNGCEIVGHIRESDGKIERLANYCPYCGRPVKWD